MAEKKEKEDSQKNKVFTKLPKGSKAPPKEQQLVASTFSKQGNILKSKRYFVLYPDSIYYFNDNTEPNPKGFTPLDFELRFELIREKDPKVDKDAKGKKAIGKVKGIRFDRDGCQCELYGLNESEILVWRDHLRGVINQRGFHDLFRAQKKIGKGNFASVYLAERLEDEILFAVKAFSKEAAYGQEKGKEALITEIQLMRELNHPHIMKLHEVFETENSLYFILDLLEGGQLYDKIKSKTKFNADQVRSIMKGLVGAVAHMNERDIMHRDLKPENILFRKQEDFDTVVIADLGLGTKVSLPEYLFVRCGTPGFVAPEVVNIKDLHTTYSAVCDMFSLGLIFHILLLGKSPFNGKTYNEVLAQNRAGTVKLEGPEYLRVSNDAFDLLKKMLQKEPEKRISSHDAYKHPYFTKQQQVKKPEKKEVKQEANLDDSDFGDEIIENEQEGNIVQQNMDNLKNSPMPTPNLLPRRLGPQKLDGDSCVSFKMNNSPLLTGTLEPIGENKGNYVIDTPSIQRRKLDSPGMAMRSPQQNQRSPKTSLSQYGKKATNTTHQDPILSQIEERKEEDNEVKEQPQKQVTKKQVNSVMANLKGKI